MNEPRACYGVKSERENQIPCINTVSGIQKDGSDEPGLQGSSEMQTQRTDL